MFRPFLSLLIFNVEKLRSRFEIYTSCFRFAGLKSFAEKDGFLHLSFLKCNLLRVGVGIAIKMLKHRLLLLDIIGFYLMKTRLTTLILAFAILSCLNSTAQAPCDISDISLSDFSTCNDNGTPFPGDDYFTMDVTVTFSNPPSSGELVVKRRIFLGEEIIASVPVSSLSGTSYTFNDISLSVFIGILNLEAFFSSNTGCSYYRGEIFLPNILSTCPISCFLFVDAYPTDETCSGYSDGSIQIYANGPGQLFYSVNNGQSFNLTGNFNNLDPGTYDILVVSHGDDVCYGNTQVTVGTGSTPEIFYKDLDGDGYSDGETLEVCYGSGNIGQNEYVCLDCLTSTEIDCDDNNPLVNPATVWYKDQDGDGYSDGVTYVGCTPPDGYYLPSQLMATSSDCNDEAYIGKNFNPGRTELCNGLDDDCDGSIDEGLTSSVKNGSVILRTQAEVNNFLSCYSSLTGSLVITGSNIVDLTALQNLTSIGGTLSIFNTGVTNLDGLQNVNYIGGKLVIVNNGCLNDSTTIMLLESITSGQKIKFGNGPCTP